jgi:hypothetical protein
MTMRSMIGAPSIDSARIASRSGDVGLATPASFASAREADGAWPNPCSPALGARAGDAAPHMAGHRRGQTALQDQPGGQTVARWDPA